MKEPMGIIGEATLAVRLARRELRTGLRGFGVFLACLALGVAAVAGVKSLAAAHAAGLARDASALLGGDVEAALPLRPATADERTALAAHGQVSHVLSMRIMARRDAPGARPVLASLRAVDAAYPLYGQVVLDPPLPLAQALASRDGLPGAAVSPQLLARLGAKVGERIRLADAVFTVRAVLVRVPDAASGLAATLGPPVLIAAPQLAPAGLAGPNLLARHAYRLKLPPKVTAATVAQELRRDFPMAGWRIRDASGAQPGLSRFMDRLTAILGLVGLTALLLGGIGIAQAVSSYLDGRTASIAAMKCLGASTRVVTWTYLAVVVFLAVFGIVPGLAAGALLPALLAPLLDAAGPASLIVGPHAGALALAGAFGLLTVLTFSLPALAWAARIAPLSLFRGLAASERSRPGLRALLPTIVCALALTGLTVATTADRRLGIGFVGAVLAAGLVFRLFGLLTTRLARLVPRRRPGLGYLALRSLGRPGNRQAGRILAALGLGLSTLCALGQVDANFAQALVRDIPRQAPAFFFMDIQPGQRSAFEATVRAVPGVSRLDVSPMSRGRVTRLRGQPAETAPVSEDARWVIRGDRGLTFAATMPRGTRLTTGNWWPAEYAGEPLVSVDAELAKGLGLAVGDTVTINALGHDITARVANLRQVNWLGLSINFVFVFSPGALDGLPLTYLATAHTTKNAPGDPDEALFRAVSERFPGISIIGVGEALDDVVRLADKIATAVAVAAGTTLLAGVLVLVQTMAAGMRRKAYEAVVFKVCGASRRDILTTLSLENALLGLLAGIMALILGSGVAWMFVTRFLDLPFGLFAGRALATVALAAGLTLGLGLTGVFRLLGHKAWPSLRNE